VRTVFPVPSGLMTEICPFAFHAMRVSVGDHAVALARMVPSSVETPVDRLRISTCAPPGTTYTSEVPSGEGLGNCEGFDPVCITMASPVPSGWTRQISGLFVIFV